MPLLYVNEQRGFLRDCVDVHACLTLCCLHLNYVSKSHVFNSREINFGVSLHLYPYFMYTSSEGPEETVQMHSLPRTFAAHMQYVSKSHELASNLYLL